MAQKICLDHEQAKPETWDTLDIVCNRHRGDANTVRRVRMQEPVGNDDYLLANGQEA